tara:strand:+ start:190 stop:555 length:366 start_codon:yes stop_codon:yes gene_type:complete
MKDLKLCEELFTFLMSLDEKREIAVLDVGNINDFFMFKTLELLEGKDENKINEYTLLFETFSNSAYNKDKFYEGFFFTLTHLLSLKFEIKRIEMEKISKKEWEKSFRLTLKKLGLMEYLNE